MVQRRHLRWVAPVALACAVVVAVVLLQRDALTPHKSPTPTVTLTTTQADVLAKYAGSASCRECHADAFDAWKQSHHALAERDVDPKRDAAAIPGFNNLSPTTKPTRVIGDDPLRQFLIDFDGGRLQVQQLAFDPHKNEWFDVFGDDQREPGDWGHWTGRGMTWNSMCAACHNTRLLKNYQVSTDTYETRMAEMAIGCEQCHGPMKDHVDWQLRQPTTRRYVATLATAPTTRPRDPTLQRISRDQQFDTCGSCHSRRAELTGDYLALAPYHDHFQLAKVDESDNYFPDGQVREEDYELAAFLGSRMHAAGVRCVDCHNPHSGKLLLQGDFLCMRCHQGIETYPTAPIIKPAEHVFHKPESTGARCVNCHMPQTTYMQRHVRHDHGFTVPDPQLTKELGIPNACNRCHRDKDADWSIAAVDKWYGRKMERHSRDRTRWIARAKTGDESARQPLINLLADPKEPPYWKASATGLLARWIGESATVSAIASQAVSPDPMVRTEAARAMEPVAQARPQVHDVLRRLLEDPVRSVRIAAAWSLRNTLELDSLAGRDLVRMIEVNADQPIGQLRAAHFATARNDPAGAMKHMEQAVKWDPASGSLRQEYAVLLSSAGRIDEAITQLERACALSPRDAEAHYLLALAYNERGDLYKTIAQLELATQLDPAHARAWYNLGLALSSTGKPDEAIVALQRAESADPRDPRIPYARATVLARLDRRTDAIQAAERSLEIDRDFTPARELIVHLTNRR